MSNKTTDKATLIQRLLAKAESTTPEEAEALTAAAERLMVKHGIDAALIAERRRLEGGVEEEVVVEHVDFEGTYAIGYLYMASAVIQALPNLRLYRTMLRGTNRERLNVVGYKSDVEQAKTLVMSLQLQALTAMTEWWKGERTGPGYWHYTENDKRKVRRGFIIAFGRGAGERIKATLTEEVAEAGGASTEIALRDRGQAAQDHVDGLTLHKGRGIHGGGTRANQAGAAAGRVANVGQSSVGGGARAALA